MFTPRFLTFQPIQAIKDFVYLDLLELANIPLASINAILIICGIAVLAFVYYLFNVILRGVMRRQESIYIQKEQNRIKELEGIKSQFYSNIAHEMKIPTNLMLESARKNLDSDIEPLQYHSRIVYNNANKILSLANQLSEFSKLEDKKRQLDRSYGDILITVKEMFSFFASLAEEKGVKLSMHCDGPDFMVNTDKYTIGQILYKLLSNAIEFIPEHGSVALSITNFENQNPFWQIKVEGKVHGIKELSLGKPRRLFSQADIFTGLNDEVVSARLSLVRELVSLLDGNLDVKSKEGKGISLVVNIPIDESIAPANVKSDFDSSLLDSPHDNTSYIVINQQNIVAQTAPVVSTPKSCTNILLISDNEELAVFIQDLLKQNNYHAIRGTNGVEGLGISSGFLPELIIVDTTLSNQNDLELIEILKQDPNKADIPVLVLSADENDQGNSDGSQVYFSKPFGSNEICLQVEQILQEGEQIWQFMTHEKEEVEAVVDDSVNEYEGIDIFNEVLAERDAKWVEELDALIKESLLSGTCNIDTLSTNLCMSRTKFFTKVKGLTGSTPAAYIREIRLNMAYELLLDNPDSSFSGIVDSLGMTDVKHFKKLFVKKFGIDPKRLKH